MYRQSSLVSESKERREIMEQIYVETKPEGAGNNWIEVGKFVKDAFGDTVFKAAPCKYPHKDSRLTVQRKYEGRGANTKIRWIIDVPENYDLVIYRRSGDKRPGLGTQEEVLWRPARKAEAAK
jgi:hypothetical protein